MACYLKHGGLKLREKFSQGHWIQSGAAQRGAQVAAVSAHRGSRVGFSQTPPHCAKQILT